MKKTLVAVLFLFCFGLCGCSVPTAAGRDRLYSITKEEKRSKGTFGGKKTITIKDFRQREKYDEDIEALKQEVGKYILAHPDLNEETKSNLRQIKVVPGMQKEEVTLLLGEPDKISKAGKNAYLADQLWTYRINTWQTFTFFILPVFCTHQGYYLYFKDNTLAVIEIHYLRQTVQANEPITASKSFD